jgi:Phage Terminase
VTTFAPARWEAYAEATRAPHFADWCARHCVQSVDQFAGRPLMLERWQVAMLGEALAELGEDVAYWQTVVLVIPKKQGKTTMLAAYALYHLLEDQGAPEILLVAATDKQAGRLFDCAVRFVRSDPWLAARLVVREHEGQIANADGFGVLHRLSADSGAAAGYTPSLVVADELAEWMTPRRRRTWAALATAGAAARQQARAFVISTAGEPLERVRGILGRLIDRNELEGDVERVHRALTVSRNHAGRTLVYNYDARTSDPRDLDAIAAANPASWVTRERLAELAANPSLSAGRFLQLHAGVWTSSEAAYLTLEQWRALTTPAELAAEDELTLGFRGADTSALVACRRADGVLFCLGAWADAGADAEDADDAFEAAHANHRVAVTYAAATPLWQTTVDGWRRRHGKRAVLDVAVDNPSPHTAQITERFRADARAGRVRHDGSLELAEHMMAAQLARARNLPYLATDVRRDTPVSAAHAALLAWEANVLAAPAGPSAGRLIFT